jgi:hypothetical protein
MIHVSFHDALSPKTAQRYVRAWKYFGRLDKAYNRSVDIVARQRFFRLLMKEALSVMLPSRNSQK